MLKPLTPTRFIRALGRILRGHAHVAPAVADNPMLRTILERRSVRSFRNQEIPDDVFEAILEAGRLAPSTVNLQTWTFDTFTRDEWDATFGRPLPFGAQRAVLVMGDTHRVRTVLDAFPSSPMVEYTLAVLNAGLAAMAMNLAAEALGVSSVMLSETGRSGMLDAGYLIDVLQLPAGVVPLTTIVFGYARGTKPVMPPKLPREAIVCSGSYREASPGITQAWLEEMMAGFSVSKLGSSFERQLQVYRSKISQAEDALQRIAQGGADSPG